jgi:hypothetical protein
MKIGQIVFIQSDYIVQVQTGIIIKREKSKLTDGWWYEVLCNDNKNHVIPGFLLSLAARDSTGDNKKYKNIMKNCASLYKNNPHLITLYT